jgi:hypothetical protein
MTNIKSVLAAALAASVSFAGVALAEGVDYDGTEQAGPIATVEYISTSSIGANREDGKLLFSNGGSRDNRASDLNTGDYYNGANRPN